MSKIFGGKKSSSQQSSTSQNTSESHSGNLAYPQVAEDLGSTSAQTGGASSALAAMLGIGGDPTAQNEAFDNFRNSSGYQFQMDQGTNAITGGAASKGLLNSGSTAKSLQTYGQGLADSTMNGYLDRLLGVGNQGIAAANAISGAGAYSDSKSQGTSSSQGTSKSSDKPGIQGLLGQGLAMASDPRLKENVTKLWTRPDGLNVYSFDYINGPKDQTGVMADEVAVLRPDALGPEMTGGYRTVMYDKLGAL